MKNTMHSIDTHAHLYLCKQPVELLVESAHVHGVLDIIHVAVDEASSKQVLEWHQKYSCLHPTVGIHPCYVDKGHDVTGIETLLNNFTKEIVAVGEIGLDYKYRSDNKALQHTVFRSLASLARQYKKPLIIHQRHAEEDMQVLLSEYKDVPAVIHCFSSDKIFLSAITRENLMVSFTGMITYSKKGKVVQVIRELPLSQIMIETDSPYLVPKQFKGRENQPSYVLEVADKIAEIKGLTRATVLRETRRNAQSFFGV